MLDTLGVFLLLHILRHMMGLDSEEHQAAKAVATILERQGQQNAAELKAAAAAPPAATTPAIAPVPALAPAPATAVVPHAVTPTGAPVALPSTVTTPQGPATPSTSPAPFPAAPPASLPPFPANWPGGQPPGWEFATPVTTAVAQRAQALVPQLWATGAGTHTTEMTGGVWITYNAEWHNAAKTVKGITAYRPKATA